MNSTGNNSIYSIGQFILPKNKWTSELQVLLGKCLIGFTMIELKMVLNNRKDGQYLIKTGRTQNSDPVLTTRPLRSV